MLPVSNLSLEARPEPVAPQHFAEMEEFTAPQIEATAVTVQDKKFEWNVETLFTHNPEHSTARTWAVRILSLLAMIPVFILDLGRRVAFALDLVDGKSFSLIDKVSFGCQKLSSQIDDVGASKELTLDEQNDLSKRAIQSHAKKLVEGFEKINGGRFHTNNSFSSPYALEGSRQVYKAAGKLVADIQKYVDQNALHATDFIEHLNAAKKLVEDAIEKASVNKFFVTNKVVHSVKPMKEAALEEFQKVLNSKRSSIAEQFVNVAFEEPHFPAQIKRGLDADLLTKEQAHVALQSQAEGVYVRGLNAGIEEAENRLSELLDEAIQANIVSRSEAVSMNDKIQPEIVELSFAAARDVIKTGTKETEVQTRLLEVSSNLQKKQRLKPENGNQFLALAEAIILDARKELQAKGIKAQEEFERIEAKKLAAAQKIADQQSLFSSFEGMLKLIEEEQGISRNQFVNFDQMEIERKALANQLESLRNTKVTIRDSETTVLHAADEYFAALSKISKDSDLTPIAREEKIKNLEDEGFTKATVDQIQAIKAIEPRLTQLITEEATLARAIEIQHDKLARLRAIYRVFAQNNFAQLEKENRKLITEQKLKINRAQKILDERHLDLVGKTGILARLRLEEPSVPVNINPQANREEVNALLSQRAAKTEKASAPPEEETGSASYTQSVKRGSSENSVTTSEKDEAGTVVDSGATTPSYKEMLSGWFQNIGSYFR